LVLRVNEFDRNFCTNTQEAMVTPQKGDYYLALLCECIRQVGGGRMPKIRISPSGMRRRCLTPGRFPVRRIRRRRLPPPVSPPLFKMVLLAPKKKQTVDSAQENGVISASKKTDCGLSTSKG
jgi:hypothetical protein